MPRRLVIMPLALAMLLTWTAFAPSHPAVAQAAKRFVGRVNGSDAFIAVNTDGQRVEAYLCDGTEQGVTLWGWFHGELQDGHVDLVSTNGLTLQLDLAGGAPQGEVLTRAGDRLEIATEAAVGAAGLWRAQGLIEGAAVLAGWVVLNDGDQRGAALFDGGPKAAPRLPLPIRGGGDPAADPTANSAGFAGGVFVGFTGFTGIVARLIFF